MDLVAAQPMVLRDRHKGKVRQLSIDVRDPDVHVHYRRRESATGAANSRCSRGRRKFNCIRPKYCRSSDSDSTFHCGTSGTRIPRTWGHRRTQSDR